jgi:hypothetical protein
MAPECLFDPSLVGLEGTGAHQTLYNSVMRCDMDLRRNLLKQVDPEPYALHPTPYTLHPRLDVMWTSSST